MPAWLFKWRGVGGAGQDRLERGVQVLTAYCDAHRFDHRDFGRIDNEWHPRVFRRHWPLAATAHAPRCRAVTPLASAHADRVIALSEATLDDAYHV